MVKRPPYAEVKARFTWEPSFAALGWSTDRMVNLGSTIVDRHAASGRVALRWFGKTGAARDVSFAQLAEESSRFAGFLATRGVATGDRVAGFMPRIPETLVAMLGAWKLGAIYVPIFTGFGADAIGFRMRASGAKVLCTQWEYRDRVPALPASITVVTVTGGHRVSYGDVDFGTAVNQSESCPLAECRRDDPAVLLYTSGSTGPPKGVAIATNFLLAIHPYMAWAVDLTIDDVFWPTGDPGWGYGLVCYMVALAMGVPVVCQEAPPSPELTLARLRDLRVTNLATTPTLLRGIMALGDEAVRVTPVALRCASSCGEPLNAEVVTFFRRIWGVTVMDQYGSSEFGLPIGNCNALEMDVRPGSMGLPLPGCRMAVVDDDGREVGPDVVGQIALAPSDVGYYSLGYWQDPARTRELFRGPWMISGDLGRRDADGYFWFEGRADDVIKSAGYRIGPFEVESAILEHPSVAEAAVIGKPESRRGHIVKAFVVLRPGVATTPRLADEIVELVKQRVGRHQAPREVEFLDHLPKTESGKIQRFLLRQR
ncbi:MAG TPA: AMP-binding protein [Candidatus Methylomirabilis sp.]|nr:AMP-binding protein [Candidatus Methylomirabilis sp.]